MRTTTGNEEQGKLDEATILWKQEMENKAQMGDTEAFCELLGFYRTRLLKLAYRYLRHSQDAEDAVMDSYEKAWEAFHKFKGDSEVYTWMYVILSNTCRNQLIKNRRMPTMSFDDCGVSEGGEADHGDQNHTYPSSRILNGDYVMSIIDATSPEDHYDHDKTLDIIRNSLDNMSDIHREIFHLRETEDLTYQELSERLNTPLGTVRSRLFHARRIITDDLNKFWNGVG